MVDYLSDGMMVIEVVGKQKPPKTKKTVNTKDLLNKQALAKGAASGDTNTQVRKMITWCTLDTSQEFGCFHSIGKI